MPWPRLSLSRLVVSVGVRRPRGCGRRDHADRLAVRRRARRARSGTRLEVVAGENVWGDIAAQIGGGRVQVTSLIPDPSADPHLYQSNAADAAAMARARIVIENGAGYDDFMGQLLSASGAHPAVVTAQRVLGDQRPSVNPHFWYDVPRVPIVAQAIERALVGCRPGRRGRLRGRPAALRRVAAARARRDRPDQEQRTPGSRSPTPSACPATCWPTPGLPW